MNQGVRRTWGHRAGQGRSCQEHRVSFPEEEQQGKVIRTELNGTG